MLNKPAPDFALAASTGQQIALQDLAGSFVVLIFYPLNDTPVCDRQLKDASLSSGEFLKVNARVLGVNTASVDRARDYCTRRRLDYPILSDPGGKVAKCYRAHFQWLPLNKRTVVVIDPGGSICFYERGVPPVDKILSAIAKRTHELCSSTPAQSA